MIRARAPLRLGFGGGGTDLPAYSEPFGGAVLNATIDLYAHATLIPKDDGQVVFQALDLGDRVEGKARADFDEGPSLALHQALYRRIVREHNGGAPLALELRTYSDAPPGSGLGSSSTLVVAMVKAYVEWLRLPLDEYAIASLAFEVERVDLGLSGGKQDQYAAAFGGFNFMEFGPGDRVLVNPLRIKNWIVCELESSLVLYHSGVSRESAAIIDEQLENIERGDAKSIDGLASLREAAVRMKESLLRGEIGDFAEAMNESWRSKKSTAGGVSTTTIERASARAMQAGALAVKVSGAGGGGFMIVLVPPDRRIEVVRALEETGRVFPCHFTQRGVEGWTV